MYGVCPEFMVEEAMVNVQNTQRVIEAIRAEEIATFNMCHWNERRYGCGTAACIGGFAEMLLKTERDSKREIPWSEVASDFFGLDVLPGNNLFFPSEVRMENITTDDAIAVLNNLIETGKVDWRVTGKVDPEP
jgi:hypothetical protein